MAKVSKDYFGLGRVLSLILAIIPITSFICGFITRIKEGKYVAAIVRIPLCPFAWIADIVSMALNGKILRLLNL